VYRVAVWVIGVLVGVTVAYAGAFATFLTSLLVYDDFRDRAFVPGSVRSLGLAAMLVAPFAIFRLVRAHGTARHLALLSAGGVGLLIALPLSAWGVLTISDFSGLD
jgi:hypothetical protein